MPKILIVAESLDPNSSSGAKANLALIKNLIQIGCITRVLHYTRQEIHIEGTKVVAVPENRKSILFVLSRIERSVRKFFGIKINTIVENKIGFSFTLFNDRNSIIAALQKESISSFDWVMTLSQGGSFRPHHALLSLPEWHQKWIAYVHDPYPMHWYPKPYTWHEPGFQRKQKFMEAVADRCKIAAFPSLLLKKWMESHYRAYGEKGIVIPHQLTKDSVCSKPLAVEINPQEFTVLHAGNLLQARQPGSLIRGFRKFLEKNPLAKARFIHVGPALHYEDYLRKEASNCDRIDAFCRNHAFEEVLWLQEHANVNIIIEAKADFSPFLPGKFPHCIATGKPILLLGPPESEARRLLGSHYPYWSEIDDESRISDRIEDLYNNWVRGEVQVDYSATQDYLSSSHLKQVLLQLR